MEKETSKVDNPISVIQKIIQNQKNPSQDKHPGIAKSWSLEQKAADHIASIIGSWSFLIIFGLFLVFWVIMNTLAIIENWDPYPFILLNLFLSTVAAFQAPIILMAQNRQSQKDRVRMEYDYTVDRKAEHEIERIKEQLDRIEKRLEK